MIVAYSLKHRGYTAYTAIGVNLVANVALPLRQVTGYHPTKSACLFDASGFQGTSTGRLSSSRPEPQDLRLWRKPKPRTTDDEFTLHPDFSEVEKRLGDHYAQNPMTATQAAEARDKFNRLHPQVKQFWDDVSPKYLKQLRAETEGMSPSHFEHLFMQEPLPPEIKRKR